MGRRTNDSETRRLAGGRVEIAFMPRRRKDGCDGEEWAARAALLTLDALHGMYGDILVSLECRAHVRGTRGDGTPGHCWEVALVTKDLGEADWQEDFWAEMEDLWDGDGGVTDRGLAGEAFGRSFERFVRSVLCGDEEASKDDNFRVDVRGFDAWRK